MTAASAGISTPGCEAPIGAHAMILSPSPSSPARSTEKKLRPGTVASAGAAQIKGNFQRLPLDAEPKRDALSDLGTSPGKDPNGKVTRTNCVLPSARACSKAWFSPLLHGGFCPKVAERRCFAKFRA